jgi:hypothetical protein
VPQRWPLIAPTKKKSAKEIQLEIVALAVRCDWQTQSGQKSKKHAQRPGSKNPHFWHTTKVTLKPRTSLQT